jgi:hypothetical protein
MYTTIDFVKHVQPWVYRLGLIACSLMNGLRDEREVDNYTLYTRKAGSSMLNATTKEN